MKIKQKRQTSDNNRSPVRPWCPCIASELSASWSDDKLLILECNMLSVGEVLDNLVDEVVSFDTLWDFGLVGVNGVAE